MQKLMLTFQAENRYKFEQIIQNKCKNRRSVKSVKITEKIVEKDQKTI